MTGNTPAMEGGGVQGAILLELKNLILLSHHPSHLTLHES